MYTLNGPSHGTIFKNVTADRLFIFSKTKCMFNKWMKINPLNGFTRINLKSFFFMRNYLFWYIFPFVLKHSSLSSSEFVHKELSHVIFYSLYSRLWFKKKKKIGKIKCMLSLLLSFQIQLITPILLISSHFVRSNLKLCFVWDIPFKLQKPFQTQHSQICVLLKTTVPLSFQKPFQTQHSQICVLLKTVPLSFQKPISNATYPNLCST